LSSTDALFTRFEELFREYLQRPLIVGFALPVSLRLEPTKGDLLRQFFFHSWDKKDPPSKELLMEVVGFLGPPPIHRFEEVENRVAESFALALEKLKFEEPKQDEEETVLLPQHPQQKLKPGRKGDPRIRKRRDIVKTRIQEPKDFLDPEIQRELLDEFHKEGIPIPRQSVNIPASILEWPEFMGHPNRWRKFVESCLKKDLYR